MIPGINNLTAGGAALKRAKAREVEAPGKLKLNASGDMPPLDQNGNYIMSPHNDYSGANNLGASQSVSNI